MKNHVRLIVSWSIIASTISQFVFLSLFFWDKTTDFETWLPVHILFPLFYKLLVYVVFPISLLTLARIIWKTRQMSMLLISACIAFTVHLNWWYLTDIVPDTVYNRIMNHYYSLSVPQRQFNTLTYHVGVNDIETFLKINAPIVALIFLLLIHRMTMKSGLSKIAS